MPFPGYFIHIQVRWAKILQKQVIYRKKSTDEGNAVICGIPSSVDSFGITVLQVDRFCGGISSAGKLVLQGN